MSGMCAHVPLCLILRAPFLWSAVRYGLVDAVYIVWHVVYQYPVLCCVSRGNIIDKVSPPVNLFGTNML